MGAGPNWTAEEKKIVSENMDLPNAVLAEKIGRTATSVMSFKNRFRNGPHDGRRRHLGQEFDERPSGWYEESVGQMLIDYKPAWEAWVHYHRYVEIEVAGERKSVLGGIVHLRCRRDADAP